MSTDVSRKDWLESLRDWDKVVVTENDVPIQIASVNKHHRTPLWVDLMDTLGDRVYLSQDGVGLEPHDRFHIAPVTDFEFKLGSIIDDIHELKELLVVLARLVAYGDFKICKIEEMQRLLPRWISEVNVLLTRSEDTTAEEAETGSE